MFKASDRRTDINYACDVVTYNVELGVITEPMPLKYTSGDALGEDIMTPFDLNIYPLSPMINTSYSAIKNSTDNFNTSFKNFTSNKNK